MRKTMITTAAGMLLLMAGQANGQDGPPRYDVERNCQETVGSVGGGEWLLSGCFDQEQRAYDGLKARWAAISPAIRAYCQETIASVNGGYWLLEGCIAQEERAAGENAGRSFRY